MGGITTLDSGLIVNGVPVGGAGVGNSYYVCPTSATAYRTLMFERYEDSRYEIDNSLKLHTTIASAYASTTSARNDTVYVAPSTYSLTSIITWANSNTHLIGLQNGKYANGVLVAQTSATSLNNMLTVSGSNNTFENIHFRHGVGTQAANLTCLLVTGDGNHFKNCWFEAPCDNSVADLSTFRTVSLAGANNTFENCHFGGTWVPLSAAGALLEYTNTTYEATFINCVFNCWIDATTPTMIYVKTGKASMMQFYKNCQFYAMSTNQAYDMAELISFQTDDGTGHHLFDINCTAVNVTDITVGINPRLSVYWAVSATTSTATGLSITTT